jgi:hypothetical protein
MAKFRPRQRVLYLGHLTPRLHNHIGHVVRTTRNGWTEVDFGQAGVARCSEVSLTLASDVERRTRRARPL